MPGWNGVENYVARQNVTAFVLAGAILALVLCLWLNERKKETGTLLSVWVTKASIMAQYGLELIFIASLPMLRKSPRALLVDNK